MESKYLILLFTFFLFIKNKVFCLSSIPAFYNIFSFWEHVDGLPLIFFVFFPCDFPCIYVRKVIHFFQNETSYKCIQEC